MLISHIKQKYQGASVYVSQAFETGNNLSPPPIPNAELPDRFLSRIGAQSVDIVPWEVAYVYANHLTYNPRPVFQSYQAYNGYLDLQNRDKYVSDSSPEYILFLADSIDNQHPSFIESKTRLAMLTHYQYIDHEGDLILLQKRSEPLDHIELSPLIKYGRLDQDISIEQTDDLLMMSFDIQYSLAGQLKRIFYQPPPLYVTLKFDDGDAREYKAIKSVINGEVLANRLIDQTNRAIKFFQEP